MKFYFKYIIIISVLLSCKSSSDILPMVQQVDFSIIEVDYLGWRIYPIPDRPDYLSISYHSDDMEETTVWYNVKNHQFSPGDSVFVVKASFLLKELTSMTESWDCKIISFVSERTEAHYYYSLEFSNNNENYRILKTDMYEKFREAFDKPLHDGWYLRISKASKQQPS